jgi:hypothetical protein
MYFQAAKKLNLHFIYLLCKFSNGPGIEIILTLGMKKTFGMKTNLLIAMNQDKFGGVAQAK